MDDRRRYKRYPTDLMLRYELLNRSDIDEIVFPTEGTVVIKDISLRGACIVSSCLLQPGFILKITMEPLFGEEEFIVVGKIVWSEEREKNIFYGGVEFIEFKGKGEGLLQKYIETLQIDYSEYIQQTNKRLQDIEEF